METSPAQAAPHGKRRRQFGTDRVYGGAPVIHRPAGRATAGGARFAVFFTAAAWLAYTVDQLWRLGHSEMDLRTVLETAMYIGLVTLLTMSASAYLVARMGYFDRTKNHRRVPRSTIDDYFDRAMPAMTVIVPSYREDERVVRQTPAFGGAAGIPEPARGAAGGRPAAGHGARARASAGTRAPLAHRDQRGAGGSVPAVRGGAGGVRARGFAEPGGRWAHAAPPGR